ncbi:regulatory protein [Cricetibacter osteomyelitidis]|uniref:Regulatory protein RecX n=1 Tax=Cricetibacter osteomyelitidis TaxID=1521931 RepID=A0A4R2T420_9PAST|nr:recombination regulator RecX [Cricetibacter osteomyelitidis]TCP96241.1 regulatory protein [Cricetibacter osteomyelitidis]
MSLALNYIVNLLSRREYSEYELRCKMQEKAFTEEEINEALTCCQKRNWQNDKRFCESYLNTRSQRGYGLNRIKQELQYLKGVPSHVIADVVAESEIDWYVLALNVLRKKFPDFADKQDLKSKQKIWRYMLSHGFNQDEFAGYVGGEEFN